MKRFVLMVLILLVVLMTGCASNASESVSDSGLAPAASKAPEKKAVPTQVPTTTNTPIPPTPTVSPPSALSDFLEGVEVTAIDAFDSGLGIGWQLPVGTIKDGVLQITGNDWNGLMKEGKFVDGDGFVINFKYEKDSEFEVMYDFGQWWTEPYRRFGIYIYGNYPKANLWLGQNGLGFNNLHGNFQLKPDTWYSLLMAVDEGGEFLAVIWDPQDTTHFFSYHETAGEQWADHEWDMRIGANQGTIEFDDFMRIKFDAIK